MTNSVQTPVLPADEAIRSRRSIRAYLAREVPREMITRILEVASRAPSGTNMQPWHVVVLTGEALRKVADDLEKRALAGEEGHWQYAYYPKAFRDPYLSRRRKVGWDMYARIGIQKGDNEAMLRQAAQNFRFFDAPVGLFFFIDGDLELGSWLDHGMFVQNVMIAARGYGLDTCPQAAFVRYHQPIAEMLNVPPMHRLVCGMALGYANHDADINDFTTEREPVEGFTQFMDELP